MHPEEQTGYQQPVYTPLTDPVRRGKVIAVIVGIIVFLGLILTGVILVASSTSTNGGPYVTLAAEHSELLNVIQTHQGSARSLDTQNYMARAKLLLTTSEDNFIDYLARRHNTGITAEAAALAVNPDIDDSLQRAAIANRFDQDFERDFGGQLTEVKRHAEQLRSEATADVDTEILDDLIEVYTNLEQF